MVVPHVDFQSEEVVFGGFWILVLEASVSHQFLGVFVEGIVVRNDKLQIVDYLLISVIKKSLKVDGDQIDQLLYILFCIVFSDLVQKL